MCRKNQIIAIRSCSSHEVGLLEEALYEVTRSFRQHTAELASTNDKLKREMADRQRLEEYIARERLLLTTRPSDPVMIPIDTNSAAQRLRGQRNQPERPGDNLRYPNVPVGF